MKRFLKIIAILLVTLMGATMLASCGMGTYERRLEKAGYTVVKYEGEKLESQQQSFEKKGYEIKSYMVATKTDTSNFSVITIIKFSSKAEAKEYISAQLVNTSPVRKGATVLLGSEDAKNIALGK
jgi:hypothetical protein